MPTTHQGENHIASKLHATLEDGARWVEPQHVLLDHDACRQLAQRGETQLFHPDDEAARGYAETRWACNLIVKCARESRLGCTWTAEYVKLRLPHSGTGTAPAQTSQQTGHACGDHRQYAIGGIVRGGSIEAKLISQNIVRLCKCHIRWPMELPIDMQCLVQARALLHDGWSESDAEHALAIGWIEQPASRMERRVGRRAPHAQKVRNVDARSARTVQAQVPVRRDRTFRVAPNTSTTSSAHQTAVALPRPRCVGGARCERAALRGGLRGVAERVFRIPRCGFC